MENSRQRTEEEEEGEEGAVKPLVFIKGHVLSVTYLWQWSPLSQRPPGPPWHPLL